MFGYDDFQCADCGEEFEGYNWAFEVDQGEWICEKCFKKHICDNLDMSDIADAFGYKYRLAKDLKN